MKQFFDYTPDNKPKTPGANIWEPLNIAAPQIGSTITSFKFLSSSSVYFVNFSTMITSGSEGCS